MRRLLALDRSVILALLVASLGYFVDIYDLLLFSVVRVKSLKGLGVPEDAMLHTGAFLINVQMAGLLVGGVLWGILGDRRGRLSVLFGSIFLYSAANIANGMVTTVDQYALARFAAGVGLAGELGAGITLIAELLPKDLRGYGTSIVAAIGILGAVFGGYVGENFDWTHAYFIGGAMGFLVLLLRVGVRESGMFHRTKQSSAVRGNFLSIFRRAENFKKYITIILVGVPIWYIIGILITFTFEFGKAWDMAEKPTAALAVLFCYAGLAVGDFTIGLFSQHLRSRKKAILIYLLGTAAAVVLFMIFARQSLTVYYAACVIMGFFAGYWAMFVTVAAEQFGTNIRSTVTTSVPNFVRASTIPMTILFQFWIPQFGVVWSAALTGLVTLVLALIALFYLDETFHKDLDYHEA